MVAICVSMIVCCSSQVLPDHFEDIAHAKAFCDVEKAARSKGSMLQGVALDVPLAVLSQQRLHVVKYYVTVPELAAADGTQHSANATLLDAARARAAERFWPSPVSNDHPENLYPKGQKQSIRDIANNLWHAVKANPKTRPIYWLEYKKKVGSRGRKKADNWLDLELPVGEKCSWWRLDGYHTWDEGPEAADPEAANGADSEGETMGGATSGESESDNHMHDYRDY